MKYQGGMRSFKQKIIESNFVQSQSKKNCFLFKNILSNAEAEPLAREVIQDMQTMALDNYFQSKLFQKKSEWEILTELESLPESDEKYPWTLLVHHLDKYISSMNDIINQFNIFPKWSLDDVMGSYSTTDSVTPSHIDSYDVFLLQLSGKRKWSVQYSPKDDYQEDQPLRILKEFKPDETFDLEPGDMLYVPHGVAHEAMTLETGLSLSIGVQALDLTQLLLTTLSADIKEYYLPKAQTNQNHSKSDLLITQKEVAEIKNAAITQILNKNHFDDALLIYLNQYQDPNNDQEDSSDLDKMNKEEFVDMLSTHPLFRTELSRFFALEDDQSVKIAIGNELYSIEQKTFETLEHIFHQNLEFEINMPNDSEVLEIFYRYYLEDIFFFSIDQ